MLSADPDLVDDIRRRVVASGSDADVASSALIARGRWLHAPLVLVGDDLADDPDIALLPRRAGVVVATRDPALSRPWQLAVTLSADSVVDLSASPTALLDRLTSLDTTRARVIGVIGGRGGAGASVLAALLAMAAGAADLDAVLVDADPGSAGLDLMLGVEDAPGTRWHDLADLGAPVPPDRLRATLVRGPGCDVLSVGRAPGEAIPLKSAPVVLDSIALGCAVAVVDLPRSRPDVVELLAPRCDVVLVVVTPDVRAATSAARTAAMVAPCLDVRLVIRRDRGGGLDAEQISDWLSLPIAAELPFDSGLVATIDRGDPPGFGRRSRVRQVAHLLLESVLQR